MDLAIEARGLTKTFGKTEALKGVDLRIPKGMVYGLLGPNGAGKTTTIRILATLAKPTSGTAMVLGRDVTAEAADVRKLISLTGQAASVDEELTGIENMVLLGRLLGFSWKAARSRGNELLHAFGLADAANRLVRTYSGGMRRRLDIAASLIVSPEILFLDEPTTGLDPRSRSQVWDIIRQIAKDGTTVVLTTQYLEEADRLAHRLAVIDQGRVIAEGTSRELKASVGGAKTHVRLQDPADQERFLEIAKTTRPMPVANDAGLVTLQTGDPAVAAKLMARAEAEGIRTMEFTVGSPSLDDVFFALTGRTTEAVKPEGETTEAGASSSKRRAKPSVPAPPPTRQASSAAPVPKVATRAAPAKAPKAQEAAVAASAASRRKTTPTSKSKKNSGGRA